MVRDPIVVEPEGFDQDAAWGECEKFVEDCGGLDESNPRMWKAASGADPGVCSCPACNEYYWCWGTKQKCSECGFEYPTDWWPMYSYGVQAATRKIDPGERPYNHDKRMENPYYRYGYEHPVEDPVKERNKIDWRSVMGGTKELSGTAIKAGVPTANGNVYSEGVLKTESPTGVIFTTHKGEKIGVDKGLVIGMQGTGTVEEREDGVKEVKEFTVTGFSLLRREAPEEGGGRTMQMAPGTQVVYIPNHAHADREHRDCELGFVEYHPPGSDMVHCRYFRRGTTELRTVANSEVTPLVNLEVEEHTDQELVAELLRQYGEQK